jgi:hypothetical protein
LSRFQAKANNGVPAKAGTRGQANCFENALPRTRIELFAVPRGTYRLKGASGILAPVA